MLAMKLFIDKTGAGKALPFLFCARANACRSGLSEVVPHLPGSSPFHLSSLPAAAQRPTSLIRASSP